MRLHVVALAVAFAASPVSAADKNEDKAKEAAVAFLKAVKSKNVDAVMKVTAAPFAYREGNEVTVLKDTDALKKWVKERLDDIKDANDIPTDISAVHTFADIKEKIKNEEQRKQIEDVVGKDGYIAVVKSADDKMIPILIRVKDGKATVVGIGR